MRAALLAIALAISGWWHPGSAQSFWPFDAFEKPSAPPKRPHPNVRPSSRPKALPDDVSGSVKPQSANRSWPWRIVRATWTEADEKAYEDFVARIGESGCRSVDACLTGADSNPMYRASNPPSMYFYADCADLPYMLRAYFAWKNNLPFSYSTAVSPIGATHDIRYTPLGNKIASRRDIIGPAIDARRIIPQIVDTISSAHYRYPPHQSTGLLPDHYPVKITRQSIKPGTIIYDPDGHVAVVYKVASDGRVHYIDTHPDNSLTRGVYGRSFSRSSPGMGAGFKRWRPLTLVGAALGAAGYLQGGTISLAPDATISDWSDEQFFGTGPGKPKTWSSGKFVLNGETLDYYEYVRKRLAGADFKYNPLDETRAMVRALCEDAKYRLDAVDIAIKAGIQMRPQPSRLPQNIYGTEGDWEIYSTPSRDARLKTAFKELRDEIARFLTLASTDRAKLNYEGADLRSDLRRAYLQETAACTFSYTKSDGRSVELDFSKLAGRLFRLSFDPYHCIERRWGASAPDELASCADDADKRAWYEAEQRLRNQISRTYDTRMGFSLSQLQQRAPGSGIDHPPEIGVLELLQASAP
jgi:hypothetical protein